MSDDDVEKVGYKKPPRSGRIQKGERRNPNGRGGKKKALAKAESDAEIMARLDNEMVEYQGRMITKKEAGFRVLHTLAMKGNARALVALERVRTAAKAASEEKHCGVLVVPGTMPLDEWSLAAIRQQAKYREALPHDEIGKSPASEADAEETDDEE